MLSVETHKICTFCYSVKEAKFFIDPTIQRSKPKVMYGGNKCMQCDVYGNNVAASRAPLTIEPRKRWISSRVRTCNRTAANAGKIGRLTFDALATVLDLYGFQCIRCESLIKPYLNYLKGKELAFLPWGIQVLCATCHEQNKETYTDYRPDKGERVVQTFNSLYTALDSKYLSHLKPSQKVATVTSLC